MKTKSASPRINVATKLRFFYSQPRMDGLTSESGKALAAEIAPFTLAAILPAASALSLTIKLRQASPNLF